MPYYTMVCYTQHSSKCVIVYRSLVCALCNNISSQYILSFHEYTHREELSLFHRNTRLPVQSTLCNSLCHHNAADNNKVLYLISINIFDYTKYIQTNINKFTIHLK